MEAMHSDNVFAEFGNNGSRRPTSGAGGRTNGVVYGMTDVTGANVTRGAMCCDMAMDRVMGCDVAMDRMTRRHMPRRRVPHGHMRMHRRTRGVHGRSVRGGMTSATAWMRLWVLLGEGGHCKDGCRK